MKTENLYTIDDLNELQTGLGNRVLVLLDTGNIANTLRSAQTAQEDFKKIRSEINKLLSPLYLNTNDVVLPEDHPAGAVTLTAALNQADETTDDAVFHLSRFEG